MTNDATRAQNLAARPEVSTWLTANAGSGKTRVLTDRVARLLLRGVSPQNILCLTYTKAAASEMQNRLFQTLGRWAMLPNAELSKTLTALGETPPDNLSRARTLFASAVEAPGGLKIQTIHSLCSTILRQFPLEASVSPDFREMDEPLQKQVLSSCLAILAESEPCTLKSVAGVFSGDLIDLAKDVVANSDKFSPPTAVEDIFRTFGVPIDFTENTIVNNALDSADLEFLKSLAPVLISQGGARDKELGEIFKSLPTTPNPNTLKSLEQKLLFQSGKTPFKAKMNIPGKPLRVGGALEPMMPQFADLALRIEAAREQRILLNAARRTWSVQEFAASLLPIYEREKSLHGFLDFDDLIRKTKDLLSSKSLEWVRYKLDTRIDHILVDEAQDTSPMQWDVIEALAEEMLSGQSDRERTLFVVGDKKQSIYSFQGADAAGFDKRGQNFRRELDRGPGMARGSLSHSFRSSSAILGAVDKVFEGSTSLASDDPASHIAFHSDLPGRVDIWPLVERPASESELAWNDSSYRTSKETAPATLARELAANLDLLLKSGSIPAEKGNFRRIEPGDIMILVQRRSHLFDQIIAACKAKSLPMAGADIMKITSELAVRDILALLEFLALPEDSLSLAAALRSPVFGWSEQDLFELAAKRPKNSSLWQSLRNRKEEFADTHEALEGLRSQVDFMRPFELIEAILNTLGGREKLIARLGPEAEDGINELLNQALNYESANIPSLTGFLSEAHAANAAIKREADSTSNMIRVMTVHGAKGLESPIVILPDTTFGAPRSSGKLIDGPNGLMIIPEAKDENPPLIRVSVDEKQAKESAERDRLLYVAMTRAEKWLIVCGIETTGGRSRASWHEMVENGLQRLGANSLDTPTGQGLRHQVGDWREPPTKRDDDQIGASGSEQHLVVSEPVPSARTPQKLLSPSDLGGSKVLDGGALDHEAAVRKGRQVHRLLEMPVERMGLNEAKAALSQLEGGAPDDKSILALVEEAQRSNQAHPDIFHPDALSEVEITAFVPTLGARISGAIDRLVVHSDRVIAVDFKTNANVPNSQTDVPEGILRQMGAYLEALESVYPDRNIELKILWTANATLMPLEHGIVRQALQRTATS